MDDRQFQAEVMRALGRIESTVMALEDRQDDDRGYARQNSTRIHRLEHAEARRKGWTAAVSAGVSAAVALILAIFR